MKSNDEKRFEIIIGCSLNQIEEMIKKGEFLALASSLQQKLTIQNERKILHKVLLQMDSFFRGRFCELLRRMGLGNLAIEIIFPFIRDYREKKLNLSVKELMEYAATLTFCGSENEGLFLLKSIHDRQNEFPQKLLYTAFGLFAQWNYEESIPLLEKYDSLIEAREYFKIVGRVNMSMALIWKEEYKKAELLLQQIVTETQKRQHNILLGSSYEILAQIYIYERRFDKAHQMLEKSYNSLKQTKGNSLLFVEKWKMILRFYSGGQLAEARVLLMKFVDQAKSVHHYESIRDSHFHFLINYPDQNEILKLFMGTPFESYKKKILSKFCIEADVMPNELFLSAFNEAYNARVLQKTSSDFSDISFVENKVKPLKIIQILFSDFFKPWSVHRLYQALYPERWYNPESSKNLIHQGVFETRRWLTKSQKPLEINYGPSGFYITSSKAILIKDLIVHADYVQNSKNLDFFIKNIKNQSWSHNYFTRTDIEKYFSVSKRTAQRWLAEAIESKLIEQKKVSRKRLYKLSIL